MRASLLTFLAPLALMACPAPPEPEAECALDLDNLVGSEWVMNEAQQDGTTIANPMARGRFYMEEDVLMLDYTIKSPSDVYTYTCKRREDQLICRDENNILGWCAALEGHELGSCTKSRLRDLGARRETDEELVEAMRAAKAASEAAHEQGAGEAFSLGNNNMGNKLQGVVYVNIQEGCRMVFIDNYRALYNGRWLEDSNPVGTNPFIPAEGEFLWETCTDYQNVVVTESAERPEAQPEPKEFTIGTELHYHFAGTAAAELEEGCTYDLEAFAQWRPTAARAVTAGEDGKLDWHVSHTWGGLDMMKLVNPVNPTAIYSLVRYKTCGETEREVIDNICIPSQFQGGTPLPPQEVDGTDVEGSDVEGTGGDTE
ncbi:MAG: hypothetical protein ACJAZO_003456 [Myxococcota bacterium]|jgi:hypothetical protein